MCITENLLILFNLLLLQLEILQQTLNQKTNVSSLMQQPVHSDNSHSLNVSTLQQTIKSLNATKNSASSKSQRITTIDLSRDDNISLLKPIVSESQTSGKNETIILDPVDVAMPQKSMLVASNSNNLEKIDTIDTIDTNETSIMNIKITNVTSLPPEVFESVPDICDTTHENTDTMRLTPVTNKMLTQLATHSSSMKRSVHEGKLTKKN